MSNELVPQVKPEAESTNILQVIARAAADPRVDADKMERFLAMHERVVAEQKRTAFFAALARLTPKLPEIGKHGTSHQGRYARLEDIDRAIRPLIAEEGFALSFDSQPMDNNKIRVICRLSHADGHYETKQIDLPIDTSGSKNGAQAAISTVSYGRRVLTKMFFNLIEAGEDTDGNAPAFIDAHQALDLEAMIDEVKADRARFLSFMNVDSVESILARDYAKAKNALESKRRSAK